MQPATTPRPIIPSSARSNPVRTGGGVIQTSCCSRSTARHRLLRTAEGRQPARCGRHCHWPRSIPPLAQRSEGSGTEITCRDVIGL